MKLAEQWGEIVAGLPRGWDTASLALSLEDSEQAGRTALILGPAAPGRRDATFRLHVRRQSEGLAPSAELTGRVLARLDREGIRGRLELAEEPAAVEPEAPATRGLAAQWDELVGALPADWSHLYAEVELDSTDFIERGALLMAPANPALFGGPRTLRFRCAQRVGYGVAPEMARRCLERLDAERITGRGRILRVVSDAHPVGTQGPVWHVAGKTV